jgi:Na+/melibiose symporter-like transporter
MVTLMFDAICDPLIGEWSDHLRSRWGRRHPFMHASAVPIAFAFYFLWNPPHGWSNQSLFIYLVSSRAAGRGSTAVESLRNSEHRPRPRADPRL